MTPTFDKPRYELIRDALDALPETFTEEDLIALLEERYPGLAPAGLRLLLREMSWNVPYPPRTVRKFPKIEEFRILRRLDRGVYTRDESKIQGQSAGSPREDSAGGPA